MWKGQLNSNALLFSTNCLNKLLGTQNSHKALPTYLDILMTFLQTYGGRTCDEKKWSFFDVFKAQYIA